MALFNQFDAHLKDCGYFAMGGQIIDATICLPRVSEGSRDDNAKVKAGETPAQWEAKPARKPPEAGPRS